jgi:starch-binding outer membrane protein, SusD/RagB family
MKIKSLIIITASFLLVFLFGCSKDLLDEKPPQIISTESLYTTLAGFDAGLNGLYATIREERECVTDIELRAGMFFGGTDNLTSNYKSSYGFNLISQLWGNANNPLEDFYYNTFTWLYSVINAANTIINQAETRNDVSWTGGGKTPDENKNRVLAEARALRAWAYRHLTFGWGDVPLSLNESLGSNIKTDWKRTPVAEVRKQIISDLLFAEKYTEVQPSMRLRITKGAVQHYLAEMYLTISKPDSAFYWASEVVNNPAYKLITQRYGVKKSKPGVPFMDMFYEGNENRDQGNTEALWVWQYALKTPGGGANFTRRYYTSRFSDWVLNGTRALVDTYERGGRGRSRQAMTKWALDLYEPQDERATNFAIRKYFILNDAVANAPYPADKPPTGYKFGDTIKLGWSADITATKSQIPNWPYSRKCEGTDPDNVGGGEQYNDLIYIRLAETYLLKAEAEYLLGRSADAAATINIVRRRSKASDVTAANINIDFILDERSRELVMEENRRWTLLRTGKWFERVKLYNKNGGQLISARDTIFPIPQVVIDANLTEPMQQNPGWN